MTTRVARIGLVLILWWGAPPAGFGGQQPRPRQPQTAVEKYFVAAREAERAGNFVEAEKNYLAAAEEAKQSDDAHLGIILNNLAGLYFHNQETAKAISTAQQAVAADEKTFGPAHPRVAADLNSLGQFYNLSQNPAEAEKCFKRALEILEKLPEPQGAQKITVLSNLSHSYTAQQRYADAESALRSAIELAEARPNYNPAMLANMRRELAGVLRQEGKESDAQAQLRETEEGPQPSGHPRGDEGIRALHQAQFDRNSGNLEGAEAIYRQLISDAEKPRSPQTHAARDPGLLADALFGLGDVCVAEHRDAEAEDLFKRAIDVCEQYASPGPEGRDLVTRLTHLYNVLSFYRKQGRLVEMEPVYEQALAVQEKVLGPEDSVVSETLVNLAQAYREEAKYEQALPVFQRALKIQEKNWGENLQFASNLEQYSRLLHELGEEDEAAATRARAEAIRKRVHAQTPPNQPELRRESP